MMNMPPFFEQVARLLAPRRLCRVGRFARCPTTPFYTPAATLERGFGARGFRTVAAALPAGHLLRRRAPPRERPDRRFTILMNPTSAGGKPLRLLPEVRSGWTRRRRASRRRDPRPRRTPPTRRARPPAAGEIVVALGGDGLVGALAGALRAGAARRRCPAGAATTSRAHSGSRRTWPAPAACCSRRRARRSTSARPTGGRSPASPRVGYDSDANRIANEARARHGNLVYAYAAHPRADRVEAGALHGARSTAREHALRGLHRGGRQHRLLRRRHEHGAGRRPVRRPARRRLRRADLEAALPRATCPRCSRAPTSSSTKVSVHRAREVEIAADRPFDVYADGDPITTLPGHRHGSCAAACA